MSLVTAVGTRIRGHKLNAVTTFAPALSHALASHTTAHARIPMSKRRLNLEKEVQSVCPEEGSKLAKLRGRLNWLEKDSYEERLSYKSLGTNVEAPGLYQYPQIQQCLEKHERLETEMDTKNKDHDVGHRPGAHMGSRIRL